MTGDTGNVKANVRDENENCISFTSFNTVLYVIHDAWRIGKPGDHVLTDKKIAGEYDEGSIEKADADKY
jgi:hypothetical protein